MAAHLRAGRLVQKCRGWIHGVYHLTLEKGCTKSLNLLTIRRSTSIAPNSVASEYGYEQPKQTSAYLENSPGTRTARGQRGHGTVYRSREPSTTQKKPMRMTTRCLKALEKLEEAVLAD